MAGKKDDFTSAPWRVRRDQIERAENLAKEISLNASAIARGALDIGLKQVERSVRERRDALEAAVEIAAAARAELPIMPSDIAEEAAEMVARWSWVEDRRTERRDGHTAWAEFLAGPTIKFGVVAQVFQSLSAPKFASIFMRTWDEMRSEARSPFEESSARVGRSAPGASSPRRAKQRLELVTRRTSRKPPAR